MGHESLPDFLSALILILSLVAESHCNHACAGGLEPNRESFMLAARCGERR